MSFNQINKNTGNRIRYKKVDAETGEEVDSTDIIKGYQVDKNVYVHVEDEEIEALQIESSHTIEIDKFVPVSRSTSATSTVLTTSSPNDKVGQDAFAVIRDAMKAKGTVGVGRVVISKRERPIILEPIGKGMRAMTLRYPYEVATKEDEYFADIPGREGPGRDAEARRAHRRDEDRRVRPEPSSSTHYEDAVVDMLKKKQAGKAGRQDGGAGPGPRRPATSSTCSSAASKWRRRAAASRRRCSPCCPRPRSAPRHGLKRALSFSGASSIG